MYGSSVFVNNTRRKARYGTYSPAAAAAAAAAVAAAATAALAERRDEVEDHLT